MAQVTTLMPEGRQRYFNNDGTPCAGGALWTYAAGTSAPKATYADADGLVPNPNPIPLDAHGEAIIYWTGAYKVNLKQADGQQVTGYPVDNLRTDPASLWTLVATLLTAVGAAMIGFIQAGTGAIRRTTQDKLREIVTLEDFGAKGDGITDDGPAVVKALATGKTVHGRTGATYKVGVPITVNTGIQSFIGHGAALDFAALAGTQVGLTVTNANALAPADLAVPSASSNTIEGWALLGPGKAGVGAAYALTTVGVKNNTSHSVLRDMLIYGWGVGVDIFTEGYVQVYDHVKVGQCGTGVRVAAGGTNYGEGIVFSNSVVYDSALALQNAGANGVVQFMAGSLDYNLKTFDLSNSSVTELHGTWLECNDAGAGKVVATLTGGAQLTAFGGRIVQNGTPGALAQDAFFNTAATCAVSLLDVFMFNLKNTANVLDSGAGLMTIQRAKSYGVSNLPSAIAIVANNKLSDGGFAGGTVQDLWYLNSDTAPIANRLTGTNTSIALSATYARSGAQSLKMAKTAGGAAGGCSLAASVAPGSRVAYSGWYKKPAAASSSGTIFVTTMFAKIEGVLANGTPNILVSVNLDTIGIGGTDALIDWTKISSGMDRIAPSWANAFIVYINAQPFLGDLYFDDFNISSM